MIGLETKRLRFRQWRKEDFENIQSFFLTQDSKFVGGVLGPEQAWRLMSTYIGHYRLLGYSYLAIEEKSTNSFIGSIGLWNSDPWPEPELGYWIIEKARGKGYGMEGGIALIELAKNSYKFNTLVSYISSENHPSKKLATRLGARYEYDIDLLQFGTHEVHRYW